MTKEEIELKADEYVRNITEVNKENALYDMRISMDLCLTKNGKFYSMIANQYRDMMCEYGIYCKDDEALDKWAKLCQELIDSISSSSDVEFLYNAWMVEAAAKLMHAMSEENIDWNRVREIISDQGHTGGTMSQVSQMLLEYSPHGVEFVERFVKPRSIFNSMTNLRKAYNKEKRKLRKKEKEERSELGSRLVKVLVMREKQLRSEETNNGTIKN